jgi:RHS repeat-associated protein
LDSIDSLTTSFAATVDPTIETTTVTEVALGYHRNQQYSITAMTTSTGAVAERYAYTAYGQPTIASASGTVLTSSAVGNRYTYTGREWDETLGLHHFRARWMSPLAGRFLGRDRIGYTGIGWSLYELTNSRVLVKLDPSGHWGIFPLVPSGWTTIFGYHYFFGNGKELNISGSNVLRDWIAKADLTPLRSAVQNNFPLSCDEPVQTRSGTEGSVPIKLKEQATWALDGWDEPEKVLNESTVTLDWTCTFKTHCKICCNTGNNGVYKYGTRCTYNFTLKDRFANPLDIGIDQHGVGYEYKYEYWKKCMSDCMGSPTGGNFVDWPKFQLCRKDCNQKWPTTELPGATAYDIQGRWSEIKESEFDYEGCD